tara:strand:+ start:845 stop:1327 length:483 start_codon:yes stop_codon:yes gene_type:complete
MVVRFYLRELQISDHSVVREIYSDAIKTQGHPLYSTQQIEAWSALAWLPGILDKPLMEGRGWVSCVQNVIEAFALIYPLDRLALLYCRGRSSRHGHATALLETVENEAKKEGQLKLFTEASLLSYPLLLRQGWLLTGLEKIAIGGISFDRYLMAKSLVQN